MASISASIIAQRLARHRKGDLIELAREAGYPFDEGTLSKTLQREIAAQLAEHLYQNSQLLSEQDAFSKFYQPSQSPMKKQVPQPSSSPAGRVSRRLAAKRSSLEPSISDSVKEDRENDEISLVSGQSVDDLIGDQSLVLSRASTPSPQTPPHQTTTLLEHGLVTSPTVVPDVIERQAENLRSRLSSAWSECGVEDSLDRIRDVLSSTVAIDGLLLFSELVGLLRQTIPRDYPLITPEVGPVGLDSHKYAVPNLFVVFTTQFWASVSVWATASLFAPLIFAYFFNLTSQGKTTTARQFDPLVFNVTKALIAWVVYSQGVRFSVLSDDVVDTVHSFFPGGWQYVVVGSVVAAVSSLYEAILQK